MMKTNYLIPTLSVLFLGVAAFFIYKGIKAKKPKKDERKPNPNPIDGGSEGKSISIDDILGIFKKKESKVSIIVDDPIKVEPFPSKSSDIKNNKIASKVLISKSRTNLREKPNASSKIIKVMAKGLKLYRVVPSATTSFIPNLSNLPVKDDENFWVYVQIDGSLLKGWVRTDAVDI